MLNKQKILFLSPLREGWKEQIELLKAEFTDIEFVTKEDTDHILSLLPEAMGIIPFRITSEQVLSAKNLKIIFIPWSGTDALPLDTIRKCGCMLANTHGNASSVAEHAVTLALAAMHRIIPYHQDLQQGLWHGFVKGFSESDQWMRLTGKRCTILGAGEIGSLLAKILHEGFQCEVKGWKKHPVLDSLPFFDSIETDLHQAVLDAEIVFITLPLTESTKDLFNQDNIDWLTNKLIINTGRATILNEIALYKALQEKFILYAGLDVWYDYPIDKQEPKYPSKLPFHVLPNVVISPHIGGYSREGQYQMLLDTMANIRAYLKTGKPIWQVNLEKGY
ncbi:2-hydroxyacid dehydrogenase [bacterium]|nr:2-hydroxyacid dehydrogenase [bacterium]